MTQRKMSMSYVPFWYSPSAVVCLTKLVGVQFEIDIYSESKEKQPVKDLVRSRITPQLRKALVKLGPALIHEHAKDIQHAPESNPSSGVSTPTWHQSKGGLPAKPIAATNATNSSVNTTTVTASDEFRTTAEEMFQTFTDPQRLAAFTRSSPRVFDGARAGGKFAIFDGNVSGEYVELDPPREIIQKWRLAQWPEGHMSTLAITFDQNDVDKVTNMRVTWTGVPVGQEEVVKRNWDGYYVRSIKQTFGLVLLFSLGSPSELKFTGSAPSYEATASSASLTKKPSEFIAIQVK